MFVIVLVYVFECGYSVVYGVEVGYVGGVVEFFGLDFVDWCEDGCYGGVDLDVDWVEFWFDVFGGCFYCFGVGYV